ncbi:oxidoreductase [Rhizorhabdus argentea]|uniref:oxidoreductase n=1 Tax=Rhizorhabdus argentea TaxID=1387174 RepID=UPI0030EDCA11
MSKVYFITGASSGFGKALAEAAIARGERVAVAARRIDRLERLEQLQPDRVLAVPLDVTDAQARETAVAKVLDHYGGIDVLANVAGRGSLGAAEEFAPEELREQFELNFFAAVEMTREVLPTMRAARSGHILNLTSIGGLASMGGFSAYAGSKFALEGWSEALRDEVAPLGIRVTLAEPGAFRTEFADGKDKRPARVIDDYRPVIAPLEAYLESTHGRQAGDPAKAAAAMIEVVQSDDPPLRLMLGADAYALWDRRIEQVQSELQAGRLRGEATALDGEKWTHIGVTQTAPIS